MRTYLVVVDETREAEIALRFAARRAAGTGGAVTILSLIPPAEFLTWSGVQATMEDEAHLRAEALIASAVGTLMEESGIKPQVRIEQGEPIATIRRMLDEIEGVHALVLGASATGSPGPLVGHFAGVEAGSLPCPVMVIPGGLSREDIDRLS